MPKQAAVETYIDAAPVAQRDDLRLLRTLVLKHLPDAHEQIGSAGFPVYTINDAWIAGFATRKKGSMLYVMDRRILDRFAPKLGELRSGASCVDWRATKEVSIEELKKIAEQMLSELSREVSGKAAPDSAASGKAASRK